MKAAVFTNNLAQQVATFKRVGFILVKCPPTQKAANLAAMEADVLNYYDSVKDTFSYRLWRNFNYVSTSTNRHSIPLPLSFMGNVTGNVLSEDSIVGCSVRHVLPFLNTQLRSHSPLVEFSTVIALPGAEKQESHTDVPFSKNNFVISAFVALAPVKLANGATCVFAGSHSEAAHQRFMRPGVQQYNTDGSADTVFIGDEAASGGAYQTGGSGDASRVTLVDNPSFPEEVAELEPGDILLFNTQVAHYGGANICPIGRPRALLSFSFQNVDNDNDNVNNDYSPDTSSTELAETAAEATRVRSASDRYNKIPEFTYHCDSSVASRNFTLNDFL